MSINTLSMYLSAFLISKSFPTMSGAIGLYGCLTFLSGMCILGILFVVFVVKETNGIDLDSLETRRPEKTESNSNSRV